MTRLMLATMVMFGVGLGAGCKRDSGEGERQAAKNAGVVTTAAGPAEDGTEHVEGDGHAPAGEADAGHGEDDAEHVAEGGHAHDEVELPAVTIGGMQVALAQGHGVVVAGGEGHLVVKLPYNDAGATTVRAWIGTEDRTASFVGKGTYAPSHDDYDIHSIAPSPLPANVMWWIEIEKPDGTSAVGSAKPILE